MRTILESVPHESHRYSTVGDWFYRNELHCPTCLCRVVKLSGIESKECPACKTLMQEEKVRVIRSSKLSDPRLEFLIQLHELVEVMVCEHDGVTQEVVDKFDKDFEANRHPDNEDEPGDEPTAPYVKQHCLATGIERILAACLDVKWKDYEDELMALHPVKST